MYNNYDAYSVLNPEADIFVPLMPYKVLAKVFDSGHIGNEIISNEFNSDILSGDICNNSYNICETSLLSDGTDSSIIINSECTTPIIDNVNTSSDHELYTLENLKNSNPGKLVLGHLNINSIRNKFGALSDLIVDKVDMFLVSETKIDESFPTQQFTMPGYSPPFRRDRSKHAGGLHFFFYINN